jgi:hypothetical protein
MPNLSNFPALDVAIGLAFMFFLLSTVSSAINEAIANVLGWRAKTLEDAVRKLLDDPSVEKSSLAKLQDSVRGSIGKLPKHRVESDERARQSPVPADLTDEVFKHWRISSLVRNPNSSYRRRARPSYLPAKAVSLAVAETLAEGAPADDQGQSPWESTDAEILKRANEVAANLPPNVRPMLKKAATNAEHSLEHFRTGVETTFNDAMERASGWYKRKVQISIAIIAALLAVGLNVDTVHIGTRLWKDPALRASVVARANAESKTSATSKSSAGTSSPADSAAKELDKVKELDLPIGWGAGNAPKSFGGGLRRVPGWILTIAALTLGAPFWFDVLSRFARLRGTGVPEKPRTLSDAGGTSGSSSGTNAG